MSSSVSSERAFSQARITISKLWPRLGSKFVEALQVVKVAHRNSLVYGDGYQLAAIEEALDYSTDEDSEGQEKYTSGFESDVDTDSSIE